jgi:hypothetical protein
MVELRNSGSLESRTGLERETTSSLKYYVACIIMSQGNYTNHMFGRWSLVYYNLGHTASTGELKTTSEETGCDITPGSLLKTAH